MKHTKEILLSICVILFLTVCLAFFWAKKNNNLPQMALPELQKGIVYDVSLNSSDIPLARFWDCLGCEARIRNLFKLVKPYFFIKTIEKIDL